MISSDRRRWPTSVRHHASGVHGATSPSIALRRSRHSTGVATSRLRRDDRPGDELTSRDARHRWRSLSQTSVLDESAPVQASSTTPMIDHRVDSRPRSTGVDCEPSSGRRDRRVGPRESRCAWPPAHDCVDARSTNWLLSTTTTRVGRPTMSPTTRRREVDDATDECRSPGRSDDDADRETCRRGDRRRGTGRRGRCREAGDRGARGVRRCSPDRRPDPAAVGVRRGCARLPLRPRSPLRRSTRSRPSAASPRRRSKRVPRRCTPAMAADTSRSSSKQPDASELRLTDVDARPDRGRRASDVAVDDDDLPAEDAEDGGERAQLGAPSSHRQPAPQGPLTGPDRPSLSVRTQRRARKNARSSSADGSRRESGANVDPMVQPVAVEQPEHAVDRSCLRVGGAVDEPAEPGVDERAGTHRARLERHVHRALVESPLAEMDGCITQRQHFSVSDGSLACSRSLCRAAITTPSWTTTAPTGTSWWASAARASSSARAIVSTSARSN